MRRALKWLGRVLAAVLVLLVVVLLAAYVLSERRMAKVYRIDPPVPAGPTAAYGAYLATACTGCHGRGFSGGHIPGTPPDRPDAANLTPDPSGLASWSEADLKKTLREGVAPGGRALKTDYMPVRVTRFLTDEEIGALYAYFHSLPAKPRGQH